MKIKSLLLNLATALALLTAPGFSFGQGTPAPVEDPSATTITSDKLQLDLNSGKGLFMGTVKVVNPRFEMDAKEVEVYFSKGRKPMRFVAKGDVNIRHGDRTAIARQAEYLVSEKKIVLTGEPVVTQKENRVTGNKIIIYPESDRMDVEGRTTVKLFP